MAMATRLQTIWQALIGHETGESAPTLAPAEARPSQEPVSAVDIAPNDPIVAYLQSSPGVVDVDKLNLDSPAVTAMREAGVKIAMPLVSQGELVGMLNLGPRLSEQEYSTDDLRLLSDLAIQAAPAVRVAQLATQQQIEARERERLEQEMRVARVIQQTLLPQSVPEIPGWQIRSHYEPAREVGGDFYDFLELPGGKLGLVVGDVTDKGVPAALVMATTRAILRAAAERLVSPGDVLQRVNELLHPDIPPKMFVTCLYAILDPAAGVMRFANAGHDLPYRRSDHGCDELRATGMPLGLMPGMTYEEKEVTVLPGESVLLYSDGLVEAHNPEREMFGFPRLRELVGRHEGGASLIDFLLSELSGFTGADWEQEDDVTLVTLQRNAGGGDPHKAHHMTSPSDTQASQEIDWETLAEFTVTSKPGNERPAMEQVVRAVHGVDLPEGQLERLKTAVAEATMNAMEHGNEYQPDLPVSIQVLVSETALSVRITDHGGGRPIPEAESPDLEAKLAGEQTPRGWGLFLIKNMVDDMRVTSDETHHTIELVMNLGGDQNDDKTP